MPKYNLDALGHEEFERLCQSLIQEIIGPGAKIYGIGSDGAREATFSGEAPFPSKEEKWNGNWIFQAKFHDTQKIGPSKARNILLKDLDTELAKIVEIYKHPCDNYILMTNVSLTPAFQEGIKDKIDDKIIPKYTKFIKHIQVLGAEEICGFLEKYTSIRQGYLHLLVTGDVIAQLMGFISGDDDASELMHLYCQSCFTREKYANLDDAGDVDDDRIALPRIFIDLNVRFSESSQQKRLFETSPEWLKQALEDKNRISALSYLLDDSLLGIVLIGGPGEGKSTLSQYISQIYRAKLLGQLSELGKSYEIFDKCAPRLPFRIILRDYAHWMSTNCDCDNIFFYLAYKISKETGGQINSEQVRKIIKNNPILLIVDGLDEVPDKEQRSKIIDNISAFVDQVNLVFKGNLRVIATSRPYGYSQEFDPNHYLHLVLEKLYSDKALEYANLWISAREGDPNEIERILKTFNLCTGDSVIEVLTKTPLQVTIMLVIIQARGVLPKQREELFDRYMDIIYQREQKKSPELLRTEKNIIYGIHNYIGYILHHRAEKINTAALMKIDEFEERVREYITKKDPLLKGPALENKIGQLIKEASQRLVLIESPREGMIGFSLAPTREFFAAAHLVDGSKNTKERDLRFRAIARSPHWHNVILFFAGRIGRLLPGEVSSMIDVCRQIDTENVDRLIRRGAELVMDMLGDKAIREPHNEIGAIQQGLTVFNNKFIPRFDELIGILDDLRDDYKEVIISPWIEERLCNSPPGDLIKYARIYANVLGISDQLSTILSNCSATCSDDTKLSILSFSIEYGIVESWVLKLLEDLLASNLKKSVILNAMVDNGRDICSYFSFPMSPKAIDVLFTVSLKNLSIRRDQSFTHHQPRNNIDESLAWAINFISKLDIGIRRFNQYNNILYDLPNLANPEFRKIINENLDEMNKFCEVLIEYNTPMINFMKSIFHYLLDLDNYEKYLNIYKQSLELKDIEIEKVTHRLSLIFLGKRLNEASFGREEFYNFRNIIKLYLVYSDYEKDLSEINKFMNENSKSINLHPYKLLLWLENDCNHSIEDALDKNILSKVKS